MRTYMYLIMLRLHRFVCTATAPQQAAEYVCMFGKRPSEGSISRTFYVCSCLGIFFHLGVYWSFKKRGGSGKFPECPLNPCKHLNWLTFKKRSFVYSKINSLITSSTDLNVAFSQQLLQFYQQLRH